MGERKERGERVKRGRWEKGKRGRGGTTEIGEEMYVVYHRSKKNVYQCDVRAAMYCDGSYPTIILILSLINHLK